MRRLGGHPTQAGQFQLDILTTGYITAFNLPFGQESVYGSFVLTIVVPGCTNPEANNFDAEADLGRRLMCVDVPGVHEPRSDQFQSKCQRFRTPHACLSLVLETWMAILTTGVYDLLTS